MALLSYRGCRPCAPDRTPTGRIGRPTSWWAPPGPAQSSCSFLFLSAFQMDRTTARTVRCYRCFHHKYSILMGRNEPSVALWQREGTRDVRTRVAVAVHCDSVGGVTGSCGQWRMREEGGMPGWGRGVEFKLLFSLLWICWATQGWILLL